jgi:RNA polymerase sigma-70 factor, ECF subfamily
LIGPLFALFKGMTNTDVFPLWSSKEIAVNSDAATAPMSDHALAIAAGQGDMRAFEQLYERHNRRVYSLCFRMTQNVAEAEDLAQEAFIQLFRKIGSFRGESAFTTWLHRLAVNQVLDALPKKER